MENIKNGSKSHRSCGGADFDDTALQNLCNAVIQLAVTDWYYAKKREEREGKKRTSTDYYHTLESSENIENFFLSDYFNLFTDMDGFVLLELLNKGYNDGTLKAKSKWKRR